MPVTECSFSHTSTVRFQLAVAGIRFAHAAGGDGGAGEDSDGGAAAGSRGEDEAVYGRLLARAYQTQIRVPHTSGCASTCGSDRSMLASVFAICVIKMLGTHMQHS